LGSLLTVTKSVSGSFLDSIGMEWKGRGQRYSLYCEGVVRRNFKYCLVRRVMEERHLLLLAVCWHCDFLVCPDTRCAVIFPDSSAVDRNCALWIGRPCRENLFHLSSLSQKQNLLCEVLLLSFHELLMSLHVFFTVPESCNGLWYSYMPPSLKYSTFRQSVSVGS
jgi:hypothetical protein